MTLFTSAKKIILSFFSRDLFRERKITRPCFEIYEFLAVFYLSKSLIIESRKLMCRTVCLLFSRLQNKFHSKQYEKQKYQKVTVWSSLLLDFYYLAITVVITLTLISTTRKYKARNLKKSDYCNHWLPPEWKKIYILESRESARCCKYSGN